MAITPSDGMPYNMTIDAVTDINWDRNTSGLQAIGRGNQDSNSDYGLNLWSSFYKLIARCNFILDNAEKVKSVTTPAIFARSVAEARFGRAYAYQNLIELYGGVPLVTKVLALNEAQVPRNTKDEVLAFVLAELEEASKDLPVTYGAADVGRATKGAQPLL
jgi:hypothetical protein